MINETWEDIPKWVGYYQVSSLGRVRSINRFVIYKQGHRRFFKGKILKQCSNGKYLQVGLGKGGKLKSYMVHVLVATTFHKKPKYKVEVMHLNDIKVDNRAENLKWGTNVENMKSAWANGLIKLPFAWERKSSKYSKNVYKNIFTMYNTGLYNPCQIAKKCNYPGYCIYSILKTYNKYKNRIDKLLEI